LLRSYPALAAAPQRIDNSALALRIVALLFLPLQKFAK
jgi:hypothetical protein